MTVSVAMTTCNGATYLQEQLESLALQLHPIEELVISDDCSTDSSLEICRRFASRANFTVVVLENSERVGYSNNFFRALSHCRQSDIVMFCDQDDWWYPEKVAVLTEIFQENPELLLAIHDVEFCDGDLKPVGYTKLQRMQSFGNPYFSYVTGMATAMRKELVDIAIPFPEGALFSYDGWVHRLAIALQAKTVTSHVLARYRRHETNVTANNSLNAASGKLRSQYVLNKSRSSPLESIKRQDEVWTCVTERLTERYGSGDTNRAGGLSRASKLQSNTRWRLQVRKKRLLLRLPAVVIALFGGRYKQFSGISSALKDLSQRDT